MTSNIKSRMKLHGYTIEVWEWIGILYRALLDVWLFIHAGIRMNTC